MQTPQTNDVPGKELTLSEHSVSKFSSLIWCSLGTFFLMYWAGLDAANISALKSGVHMHSIKERITYNCGRVNVSV